MSSRYPLRLFFGQFNVTATYAADIANNDPAFADFLTGVRAYSDPDKPLHHHRPVGPTNGQTAKWDEYLDLNAASIEPSKAEDLTLFRDIAGVEDVMPWQESSFFLRLPTNRYTLATDLTEFLRPTRRLSKPFPRIAPSPARPVLKLWNLDLDINNVTGYFQFWLTIWNAAGTAESSPSIIVQIPYTTLTDDIRVTVEFTGTVSNLYSLYRAPITVSPFNNILIPGDFPIALTGHHKAAIASSPVYQFTSQICNASYEGTFLVEDALNDARARINFDYQHHARIDEVTEEFLQEWLVLNSATHKYYKGLIVGLSPALIEGYSYKTEDTGQIILQITDEGRWYNEAWDNPDDSYLDSYTRSTL